MNADREPNRLPLRAGAMLLLAVAVVFLLLGIKSASDSGKESPQDKLAGAGQSAQATSETSASAAPGSSPAASAEPTGSAGDTKICVLNAGSIAGLAGEVSEELKSGGFPIGTDPANLPTSSITENTVFYAEGDEEAAKKVAEAVPGGASAEERPAAFTRCDGEIAVIVVSK